MVPVHNQGRYSTLLIYPYPYHIHIHIPIPPNQCQVHRSLFTSSITLQAEYIHLEFQSRSTYTYQTLLRLRIASPPLSLPPRLSIHSNVHYSNPRVSTFNAVVIHKCWTTSRSLPYRIIFSKQIPSSKVFSAATFRILRNCDVLEIHCLA